MVILIEESGCTARQEEYFVRCKVQIGDAIICGLNDQRAPVYTLLAHGALLSCYSSNSQTISIKDQYSSKLVVRFHM
jgi:hypothetical protein